MAKKNRKNGKVSKIAAQTVKKAEPKVAETKPEPAKPETKPEPTKLTVVKDTRTKDEKRRDRLALREKALAEALAQDLPFNEKHPAMAFEQNYEQAFEDATTSPNAIPAAAIKAAKAKLAESLSKMNAPAAEEGRIGERILAKANDTPAITEAIKHFNKQVAEGVEEVKPLVEGTLITANDNTEQANDAEQVDREQTDQPTADPASPEAPDVVVPTPDQPEPTNEDRQPEAAVATDQSETRTNEFDEQGKLIRWPNESSKAYNRRKHQAKLSGAWKKPEITTVTVEPIDGGVEITGVVTRNGEPPVEVTVPSGQRVLTAEEAAWWTARNTPVPEYVPVDWTITAHEEHIARVDAMMNSDNEELKVDDDLVKNGSFAATAEAETSDATQDVPETQKDQPEEVQKPVQTEPVSTPVEPGPSEAKTDKTPSNVISINNIPMGVEAKKFYGAAFTNERAKLLAEAYRWLTKAVDAEASGNTTTLATMMKAALRKEADAFAIGVVQAKAA